MVQVYVKLILSGRRTIEQVPISLREKVVQKLTELNIGQGGIICLK